MIKCLKKEGIDFDRAKNFNKLNLFAHDFSLYDQSMVNESFPYKSKSKTIWGTQIKQNF